MLKKNYMRHFFADKVYIFAMIKSADLKILILNFQIIRFSFFFRFKNMAKNYFKSYIWLIDTLQIRGALTLKEIKDLWRRSSINDEGKELATRTFSNHVVAIADVFGIDIKCDRSNNKYYIDNTEDVGGNRIRQWMLDALSLNNLLNESAALRNRILFEEVPSRQKFIALIIQTMRDSKKLKLEYKSYNSTKERSLIVEPYFLKEFKRRWYLYGCINDDKEIHTMALDRIVKAEILPDSFVPNAEFCDEDFFYGIYGVRVYPDMKKEKILLKVSAKQSQYFRSLPLHRSQKEIVTNDDYSIFSYNVAIDYDLRQDILAFGTEVEVLEPKILRKEMKEIVNEMFNKYK